MSEARKIDSIFDRSLEAFEQQVVNELTTRGKSVLETLIASLTPDNATRVFRLIENFAKHHRELIAATYGDGDTFKKNFLGTSMSEFGLNFNNQEENFGAQLAQAVVKGKPTTDNSEQICNLTQALISASNAKMHRLASQLQDRIQKLLDSPIDEAKPEHPEIPDFVALSEGSKE